MKISRGGFVLFLFIWLSILDYLVLSTFSNSMTFYDSITGNVVLASSYNEVYLPLFIFNIIIGFCLIKGYYSLEKNK